MDKLTELKKIEADLQDTRKEIVKAQAIEDEKNAERRKKREIERREAETKAFQDRQNLINLEKSLIPLVKAYSHFKRNHVKNEITAKWDAFLADLRGEKPAPKTRKKKAE